MGKYQGRCMHGPRTSSAASASYGSLSEINVFRSCPRSTESVRNSGAGTQQSVFKQALQVILMLAEV